MVITLCVAIIILFVKNSSLVITGASKGLMLWYKNLLPLLLPFMLISGILVGRINGLQRSQRGNSRIAILSTIFIGIFCGYPLGARVCSDFSMSGSYDRKTGNLIIALCNNSSPMFISGFVARGLLNNLIPFWHIILYIYIPYFIILALNILFAFLFSSPKDKSSVIIPIQEETSDLSGYLMNTVSQITMVGIYVMLCSIVIEFVYIIPGIPDNLSLLLSGVIEITRGTTDIMCFSSWPLKIKAALIIALTSFGGISSVFQTQVVIQQSELSIASYILQKIICSISTFAFAVLFI